MQYSSVIFFASRDIVVRAGLPLSRQVHSVGQCQGGGRLYGRGERLLIWRAAKTYQGLRRLSRVHVSFRVKAFQDISPTRSWHIRHRLKMTNNIYQQRLIQSIWKFRKCLAKLVFFLVNWSRDETIRVFDQNKESALENCPGPFSRSDSPDQKCLSVTRSVI